MKKLIVHLFFTAITNTYCIAQKIEANRLQIFNPSWHIGAGVFAGPSYATCLPANAYFLLGNHYGVGVSIGYQFLKKWSVFTGLRYMQQQQVYNFNNEIDPDEFISNASTFQIPFYTAYHLLNKKHQSVCIFTFGAGYQFNTHRTVYNVPNLYLASTSAYSQKEEVFSSQQLNILSGIYLPFSLTTKYQTQLVIFTEYQQDLASQAFIKKVNYYQPYLVFANTYKFVNHQFRLGCFIQMAL